MGGKHARQRQHVSLHRQLSRRCCRVHKARKCRNLDGVAVLVVDDNETNRRIVKEMLQSWGMSVETVEGGPAGDRRASADSAEQRALPLVISDVNMPEMDGFMLAEQLRSMASLRETAIIMLTSGGRQGDIKRCKELNVSAHLMKPVKHSELLKAIMLAVGHRIRGVERFRDRRGARDRSAFTAASEDPTCRRRQGQPEDGRRTVDEVGT